ncbi:hypothetical protein ACFLQ5_02585 [Bacteroidota bacterium]
MKKLLFVFGILLISTFAIAQTAENIKSVQEGEQIIISYQVKNLSEKDVFRAVILAKLNSSNLKTKLVSISGDVGDNIKGGKDVYKAVWDVLKDINNLTDAEFFVEIELMKGGSTIKIDNEIRPKKWFVAINSAPLYTPLGLRIGYMKGWGGFVLGRFGSGYSTREDYDTGEPEGDVMLFSITGGITKRVIDKNKFKLHTYIGGGYGIWGNYILEADSYNNFKKDIDGSNDDGIEFGYGLIGSYKRFIFCIGATHLSGWSFNTDFNFGLGYSF